MTDVFTDTHIFNSLRGLSTDWTVVELDRRMCVYKREQWQICYVHPLLKIRTHNHSFLKRTFEHDFWLYGKCAVSQSKAGLENPGISDFEITEFVTPTPEK